jgi:hypothetical protein
MNQKAEKKEKKQKNVILTEKEENKTASVLGL